MTASEVEKTAAETTSPNAKADDNATKTTDGVTEKHKEAMNHFVAGKRNLVVKDLDAAVTSFAMACELLSAEFGDTAYECADAYYYYGKALLEMARTESGVFGAALDGVPDGEDSENSQVEDPDKMTEDERDEVEQKVGEALDENFTVLEEKKERREKRAESTEEETEGEDAEEEEGKPEEESKAEDEKEEKSKEDEKDAEKGKEDEESVGGAEAEKKEGEDKKEQEEEDEEDPSNLQLAWEMLELAKVAYSHKLETCSQEEKKGIESKICETLLVLGEVSVENETYEQAVTDIKDCLERFKKLHAADSRCIAETHYQLGVALGHAHEFEESVKSLEDAISVIKLRIENLKKNQPLEEAKGSDAFYSRETEIAELESLIPEIQEKIQDVREMVTQQTPSQGEETNGFPKNGDSTSAKPISCIAVKRKADSADSSSPKKVHLENGVKEG